MIESPTYWIDVRCKLVPSGRIRRPVASIDAVGKKAALKAATDAYCALKVKVASVDFDPATLDEAPPIEEPKPQGVDFGKACKLYLEHRTAQGKLDRSYDLLRQYWVPLFADRTIASVESDEIETALQTWTKARKWTPATRNNVLMQLSGLLSYAYGRRWIESHPTERGRVPLLAVDNARKRWLRRHEIEALKLAAPIVADQEDTATGTKKWLRDGFPALVSFACSTGMRLSEVCDLRLGSYQEDDQGNAYVITGKTKNGTRLAWPLEGETHELVKTARAAGGKFPGKHLFGGPRGGSAESSIKRWLPVVCKVAKIPYGRKHEDGITFHTFRHSMASLALNAGVPEIVVQQMGNWKTASMTRRYAHLSDETMRAAAGKLASIVGGGQRAVTVNENTPAQLPVAIAVSA
jgi:integrase